jgi:glycogen operon protein
MYGRGGRRPFASINFVTAHDGFTLHDLVSYTQKHNEPNGEANRDGTDNNLSWNCGAEGPTDGPAILTLRGRQARNFLATLLLSQGVPMLCGGDEMERTQRGNNHAYCQDNPMSWHDWKLDGPRRDLLAFTRHLIALRGRHPVLRRRQFFYGRQILSSEVKDLTWFRPDGKEMAEDNWRDPLARCIGLRLAGDGIEEVDARGERITDDTLLVLLNAHHEALPFILPAHRPGVRWEGPSGHPDARRTPPASGHEGRGDIPPGGPLPGPPAPPGQAMKEGPRMGDRVPLLAESLPPEVQHLARPRAMVFNGILVKSVHQAGCSGSF